jgi:ribosomal-protein-alanine N-acetyltransferase
MLPEFWGKGYGTEMAKILLKIGFNDVQLHKLYARCNVNNSVSKKVMENIGMKKEGELRKVRFKDNMWVNEFVYGILVGAQ